MTPDEIQFRESTFSPTGLCHAQSRWRTRAGGPTRGAPAPTSAVLSYIGRPNRRRAVVTGGPSGARRKASSMSSSLSRATQEARHWQPAPAATGLWDRFSTMAVAFMHRCLPPAGPPDLIKVQSFAHPVPGGDGSVEANPGLIGFLRAVHAEATE